MLWYQQGFCGKIEVATVMFIIGIVYCSCRDYLSDINPIMEWWRKLEYEGKTALTK